MRTTEDIIRVFRERQRVKMLKLRHRCVRCGQPALPGQRMCWDCAVTEADRKSVDYTVRKMVSA